ncbi:LysR family transcriptional regulator [Pseudomonas asplenii]|uniref:Transcriptional regulator, LysR family n=1 Tax=Pseudomonas asplenii TaxID=53407 RepID=A0A0N0VJC0_9PSED|nr:LysR family transcriptional regulator [Pseudomonas fuscovaginae]KPA90078.1 transcriptional regulator, LysR family [Pseudomonas fuscovaginae]KPA97038.1 transcriptional regulator, LysR family [Pseudomonas fuscovaginae]
MIDNLPSLRTFVRVVAAGSLSAAAREMDLSLAMVSKRLTQLERELGIRLLQRTTRKQVLTEEGELFHAEAVRILAAIEQAEAVISGRSQAIDGTVRLSAPVEFGRQWIAPAIAAFQKRHPKLRVQLELSDVVVDLLDANIDLAIRFGNLADSSLIARPLAPNFRVLCASPDYLRQFGEPTHPNELVHHQCILIGSRPRAVWTFDGEEPLSVQVTGTFVTNDGSAAHALALEGAGIARKSIWDVGDEILDGRLNRVLPTFAIAAAPLNAIYPTGRHLAPRVRALVEFLGDRLGKAWRWERMRQVGAEGLQAN